MVLLIGEKKVELDKIEICTSNTTKPRMKLKEKRYIKQSTLFQGASKFAIANEYENDDSNGAQGTNAFTSLSKQFIPMMSQVVL
jgi:hypothetical protein